MVRPTINIDHAEFEKMYNSNKVPISDIADHFKISRSSVRMIRLRLNIPTRRGRFDETEYRRLFKENVSYPQMSRQLGISTWTVMEIRKRLNLSARKRGLKKAR